MLPEQSSHRVAPVFLHHVISHESLRVWAGLNTRLLRFSAPLFTTPSSPKPGVLLAAWFVIIYPPCTPSSLAARFCA